MTMYVETLEHRPSMKEARRHMARGSAPALAWEAWAAWPRYAAEHLVALRVRTPAGAYVELSETTAEQRRSYRGRGMAPHFRGGDFEARFALDGGHEVCLVTGPGGLQAPLVALAPRVPVAASAFRAPVDLRAKALGLVAQGTTSYDGLCEAVGKGVVEELLERGDLYEPSFGLLALP